MMENLKVFLGIFIKGTIHLLFWVGVYFFYTYYLGYGSTNIKYINKFTYYLMPITISIGYFFLYFLIPKYLLVKKHFFFILYSIYTFIISFFFIAFSIFYGMISSSHLSSGKTPPLTKTIPYIIFGVYFIILIIIFIGLVIQNYKSTLRDEDLKNKFLQTQLQLKEQELKYLKMQIHPHFLFNTLNTLYGFALKKADEAPDMILKLSSLLDYILYQVEKPEVLLVNEIQHIEDYISLEKMRFQDSLNVKFSKEIHNDSLLISPMIFLPFVENTFKHGMQINGILTIDINIKTSENSIDFSISNSHKNFMKSKKGIGLTNIKKRLTMLFQNNFTLETKSSNNVYEVQLKIPARNE